MWQQGARLCPLGISSLQKKCLLGQHHHVVLIEQNYPLPITWIYLWYKPPTKSNQISHQPPNQQKVLKLRWKQENGIFFKSLMINGIQTHIFESHIPWRNIHGERKRGHYAKTRTSKFRHLECMHGAWKRAWWAMLLLIMLAMCHMSCFVVDNLIVT